MFINLRRKKGHIVRGLRFTSFLFSSLRGHPVRSTSVKMSRFFNIFQVSGCFHGTRFRFTGISFKKMRIYYDSVKVFTPVRKTGELQCRLNIKTHYLLQRNYITISETETGICHSAAVPLQVAGIYSLLLCINAAYIFLFIFHQLLMPT